MASDNGNGNSLNNRSHGRRAARWRLPRKGRKRIILSRNKDEGKIQLGKSINKPVVHSETLPLSRTEERNSLDKFVCLRLASSLEKSLILDFVHLPSALAIYFCETLA